MNIVCLLLTGEARNPLGSRAPLDMLVGVGVGSAYVFRDGRFFADGESPARRDRRRLRVRGECLTLRELERYVRRRRAGHLRWRVELDSPLWSAAWERRGPRRWVCVESGRGFA